MPYSRKDHKLRNYFSKPNRAAPMHLSLYIGNDLIESLPIDAAKITAPGYIGALKRELEQKHEQLIHSTIEEPEFLIIGLAKP